MGFNYNQQKESEQHGNPWTSYSDLFMGLSFVFLLLYVTASLRSGTTGIQQQMQSQKLALENEDLKNQLKVYTSIKKDYLEQEASQDEEKLYSELMDKLDLLQDQAKAERDKLRETANELDKKDRALNKYQQLVRNIVNANMVAKSKISRRDDVIEKQETEISEQSSKIEDMEKIVQEKKRLIAQGEARIEAINEKLESKMKELQWAVKHQKMTNKKYKAELAAIEEKSKREIQELDAKNAQYHQQVVKVSEQLEKTQGTLAEKEAKAKSLEQKLASTEKSLQEQEAKLRQEFASARARDKEKFENDLNKEKLSSSERAAKEAAYRAQQAQKANELEKQIQGLQGKLRGTEAQLAKVKAERDARKAVADEIKAGFAKVGVAAEVDGETGDVTIDFGDQYFDTGKSDMKPAMADILKKAMPVYSKALLENKKIGDRINAVEIVGFASPTYKGRYIDPNSLDPQDKKAVEFNLDLSYQRAKSIFQFAFDPKHVSFDHQRRLRPLVKVSGKSFFEAAKVPRDLASTVSAKEFCNRFDCKKSQRVLIRFSIDPKK